MAKNVVISPKTAADIEQRVDRVIRGLGNPEPPLELDDVRELLRLDRRFYTADDTSAVGEVVSKIRVASKQVLSRPSLLWDAIKKLELKALYVPDRKRILLDATLPRLKHRWNEAHEIGHSLLPWHESVMHGDDAHTLSHACHEMVESEANYTAGRLLFLQDRFVKEVRSTAPSLSVVRGLGKAFGNTAATTLYRYVESCGDEAVMLAMITCHPHEKQHVVSFTGIAFKEAMECPCERRTEASLTSSCIDIFVPARAKRLNAARPAMKKSGHPREVRATCHGCSPLLLEASHAELYFSQGLDNPAQRAQTQVVWLQGAVLASAHGCLFR